MALVRTKKELEPEMTSPVTRANRAPILFLIGLIVSACGPSAADLTPTVDPNAIRTQAVATFSVALTQTQSAKPTATPSPSPSPTLIPTTSTPGTPGAAAQTNPSCYGLLFVADVTIPDNTTVSPGQKFTKTWRAQNSGSCAWAPGFTFSLIGGEAMGGQTLTLTQAVPVGATADLSIEMTAPTNKTGKLEGTWQMADSSGLYFGNALFVIVVVGGSGTPASTST